tara:strand:+ start:909 stop:1196 length:288 start_codon:yes stop_codon:yes gene_type:complete
MALTFGSLRHTPSGRKRKPLPKAKRYTPEFKELETKSIYRRETPYYPSMKEIGAYAPAPDTSYKVEESKNFTIAPAYNKGAYQVINRNSVKDIGR